jgi:hypothetical protein
MIYPMFAMYGIGVDAPGHLVLIRSPGSPDVQRRYPAVLAPRLLSMIGRQDLFVMGDPQTADPIGTYLAEVDTNPPDQGDILQFGVTWTNGPCLVMPLEDGRFVIASGIFVYVSEPEAEEGGPRIQLAGLAVNGNHYPVAISRVGSAIRILYVTRGNTNQHAYLLSFDLAAPPFGTVIDLQQRPQYAGSVTWPYVEQDHYNWYTGLIPHVMGAFDYCVFRNADRSSDGTANLFVGVAIGAPFADGGQMMMSGYQVTKAQIGEASFDTFTSGGTLTGTTLTSQTYTSAPVCTTTDMINASGVAANPDDYFFDSTMSTLLLSFETPPVPVFWTNMRRAVEVV